MLPQGQSYVFLCFPILTLRLKALALRSKKIVESVFSTKIETFVMNGDVVIAYPAPTSDSLL